MRICFYHVTSYSYVPHLGGVIVQETATDITELSPLCYISGKTPDPPLDTILMEFGIWIKNRAP